METTRLTDQRLDLIERSVRPPRTLTDRVVMELVEEIRRLRSASGEDTPTAS